MVKNHSIGDLGVQPARGAASRTLPIRSLLVAYAALPLAFTIAALYSSTPQLPAPPGTLSHSQATLCGGLAQVTGSCALELIKPVWSLLP